jgi:hypothetical protein
MTEYRPLSKQGVPDADLDNLHDGVEPWMREAVLRWGRWYWLRTRQGAGPVSNEAFLTGLEMALRLREPFSRVTGRSAVNDLETRIARSPAFGMNVVGYAVSRMANESDPSQRVRALSEILEAAGSAWEVSARQDGGRTHYSLTRRDLASARDAITEIRGVATRAADLLSEAWLKIATRDPDPPGAYDKAIKAVEAAAQPVVSPKHATATLGSMIGDMKASPGKWSFVLDDGDVGKVIAMCETLWKNHYRHGTQLRDDHTLREADAAVHVAIPLVRYFSGGLVVPL